MIVILALASFVIRLKLAFLFLQTPYHEFTLNVNGPDQNRFLVWAESIRAGYWQVPGTAPDAPFQFSPVYPWLLSLSLRFRENPFFLIFALQALGSALAGLAIWDIGRRLGSAAAGWIAAVLWLFYAPSIFYDGCLIRESLLASTGLLAFWAALRAWDSPSAAKAAAAGLLLGVCTAVRPHVFSVVLSVVFLLGAARRRDPQRLKVCAILILAACAVITPITLRNLAVSGQWVPISTQGADALILGNDPSGPGVGHAPTERSMVMLEKSGNSALKAFQVIIRECAAQPRQVVELYARKLRMLFNDYETPANYSFYVWRLLVRPTRWFFLQWGFLFPLACLGAWAALRRQSVHRSWRLALMAAGILLGGAALIHIQARYRFVAVPFLALLAGCGVVDLWKSAAEKRWLRLAAAIAAAALIGLAIRPLPSYGYYRVTGGDGIERLNRDPIQNSDYVTLLASWMLSGAKAQDDAIRIISNRAYRSYGLAAVRELDRSMRALRADPTHILSRVYLEKYRVLELFPPLAAPPATAGPAGNQSAP